MHDDAGEDIRGLQQRAALALEQGALLEASRLYARLVALRPEGEAFHFRLALVHKYLREWAPSLRHNLRALQLSEAHDEGASWNAGIAATALGEWAQARRQWRDCGIDIDPGEGPIVENFGPIGLRLNPWGAAETVFARRIDPARARITNVPLPSSGHRFGDLVLHDGAQVGERHYLGHTVPVFNALQRLVPSPFASFTVFVACDSDDDIDALQAMRAEGLGLVEDWTRALGSACLRCSHGLVHTHRRHEAGHRGDWNPDRTLGVAALDEAAARGPLASWVAQAPARRRLEAIALREQPLPEPPGRGAWWR